MLSVKPDAPIDQGVVEVLRAVDGVAAALGVPYFLVGATARDILLVHVFGLPPGRATRDVDFALVVPDWATFEEAKGRLQATERFLADPKYVHRLRFRGAGSQHDLVVDLIPFGGVAEDQDIIKWPPDLTIMMRITGFQDAFDAATPVQIEPNLVVNVASFPGLALLKLFAWQDRRAEEAKDAHDLLTLLRNYEQIGNQERIYAEALSTVLEQAGFDPELVGAWLLGRDAAEMAAATTRAQITALLEDAGTMDSLITDMAKALRGREDSITYATTLSTQFKAGFSSLEQPRGIKNKTG